MFSLRSQDARYLSRIGDVCLVLSVLINVLVNASGVSQTVAESSSVGV